MICYMNLQIVTLYALHVTVRMHLACGKEYVKKLFRVSPLLLQVNSVPLALFIECSGAH